MATPSTSVPEEASNGRTTAFDDRLAGADRYGARILPTILTTHAPLDLVILMLGANDMKPWIHGNPVAAKQGMDRLIEIVLKHDYPFYWPAPKVLIVSPPPVSPTDNAEFKRSVRRRRRGIAEASRGFTPNSPA